MDTTPQLPPVSELPHVGRHHYAYGCGTWRPIGFAPCPRCPDKCPGCGSWKVTRIPDPIPQLPPEPTTRATYPNARTYGTATDDPRPGR